MPDCPIVGGYSFHTYSTTFREQYEPLKNKDWPELGVCSNITWRISHLDSECIRGEGIELRFPLKACNVFTDPPIGIFQSFLENN